MVPALGFPAIAIIPNRGPSILNLTHTFAHLLLQTRIFLG
jgi:hypothetical protein